MAMRSRRMEHGQRDHVDRSTEGVDGGRNVNEHDQRHRRRHRRHQQRRRSSRGRCHRRQHRQAGEHTHKA